MNEITLDAQIEAILFFKAEPQSYKKLAEIFVKSEEEIKLALEVLNQKLSGRGIQLVFKDNEVTLNTSSAMSELIGKLTKEELVRDLGKAGLETLSIILYRGPISRAEIDYIRGVQSNFILRNLQIRGLIEKVPDHKDQRKFLYRSTFDLLSFLGISKIEDLPEFEKAKTEFNDLNQKREAAVNSDSN